MDSIEEPFQPSMKLMVDEDLLVFPEQDKISSIAESFQVLATSKNSSKASLEDTIQLHLFD